jgi:photosystem II stability/assembly factor-like uncharacterized protein
LDGLRKRPGLSVGLLLALALVIGCATEVYEERFGPGDIDVYDDLYSVSAVGENHVWAGGYFGSIYRSVDGGKSWRKLESGTEKSINAIGFADERNGWAVGRQGYVVRTTDGGDTWERQSIPRHPQQHLFAVTAIDKDRAWIVGTWGGRYYTENGGRTWEDRSLTVYEGHPVFKYLTEVELDRYKAGEIIYDDIGLNDVFFLDDKRGWIVGEWGSTWWTDDGGTNWNEGAILGDVQFEDIYFDSESVELADEHEAMLERVAQVLSDRDYLRVKIEGFITEREYGVREDTFLADDRADAIKTFLEDQELNPDRLRVENRTPFDEEVVDMAEFRKNKTKEKGFAVIRVIESPYLFDVKFKDPKNGLIAGLGGVILKSDDGGRTWRYTTTQSRQAFFSVGFRGSDQTLAVGEKGLKRISQDDGIQWKRFEDGFPSVFTFMRDMTYTARGRGWIVGQGGTVLRSADGGETWVQVLPPGKDSRDPDSGAGE